MIGLALALAAVSTGSGKAGLSGHGGPVTAVALAPDGRLALTASFDYTLKLWDLERQTVLQTLRGHNGAVTTVAFLPDSRHALSGGDDGTLRLWDAAYGQELHSFDAHHGKVSDVALAPGRGLAASAGWDGRVRLWDLEARKPLRTLDGDAGMVNAVAFTADGRHVVAVGAQGHAHLYPVDPDGDVAELPGQGLGINALALTGDGRALAGGVDGRLHVWSLAERTRLDALEAHDGPLSAVAVAGDGDTVATSGTDGVIRLWALGTRTLRHTLEAVGAPVWDLTFGPDGTRLLAAGGDGTARLFDVASGKPIGGPVRAVDTALPEPESRGAELFRKCAACHTLTRDGGNRAGPTLYKLFGRKAGGLAGYDYSKALERAQIVWTPETVSRLFAKGPHVVTPGSKMPIQRMPDAADRRALIAYIERHAMPDGNEPAGSQQRE
ncbi:MAG: c-type cytochrome [Rhodovibrio sp.]|nr:c-type cytochrome [Rhodovibrio sp.]